MDSNGGIGKLLTRSIASKRRRKKEQRSDAHSEDMGPRGPSPAPSRETMESDSTNNSQHIRDADQSSLVSFDSDAESLSSARPTAIVSAHPSQIGYLTTSSPLVQEEHLRGSRDPPGAPSPRSTTFPAQRTTPPEPNTSLNQTQTGLALPKSNETTRSSSPVGRLREAFRSKKSLPETGNSSPERKSSFVVGEPSTDEPHRPDREASEAGASASRPAEQADTPNKTGSGSTERFRRLSRGQKIDTSNPPQTPPSAEKATPVIVNTPPTPTDHSSPSIPRFRIQTTNPTQNSAGNAAVSAAAPDQPRDPAPVPGNMISQRRVRSGSGNLGPSKLSSTTLAPLSPTPENGPPSTPSASSFFSSMISAAQNAANTLSNTIQNTNIGPVGNGRPRGPGFKEDIGGLAAAQSNGQVNDKIEVVPYAESTGQAMDSKEPAVRTLGMGDLSLSHLGISEPARPASTGNAAPSLAAKHTDGADLRSRSESAPPDPSQQMSLGPDSRDDSLALSQSRDAAGSDKQTTPSGSLYEDKSGLQRTGSIRSAIGRHRKRGSSAISSGTGNTIAAAISAANASVAHPSAQASMTKLTGFAVASKKRNRDFHTLFKSVPDDDYLIEDYSCALQREILAHGRLYVSEGHLCFSSNIFGWVTTLVMSFDEIVSVEKRSTALVFKNGLMISTLHAKHIFASFTSRDSTYDLIVKIWKLGHPSLQSSLNGVRLEETGGDKTEKVAEIESTASQSASEEEDDGDDSDDEDDVYDEDEVDEEEEADTTQLTELRSLDADGDKTGMRKPSGSGPMANGPAAALSKESPNAGGVGGAAGGGGGTGEDFPGPLGHSPTDCGESDQHYDKVVGDEVIAAPLGKVFNLIFGQASVTWMSKWLTGDQKCFDLQMEDQKGLGPENRTRTFSYTKPLFGSIGPKQTKCIITEHIDAIDFEKAVSITCTTQTPDVPSGNIFSVKTKYCMTWAENNSTRFQASCAIDWTGKSWLKVPIEKGANDGQVQYVKDLITTVRAAVSSRPRPGTATPGAAVKGKKRGRKSKTTATSAPTSDAEGVTVKAVPKKQTWGVFEPVHGLLGPIVDILMPLMTGNVVYGLLVGLLVASWFGFGFVVNGRSSSRNIGSGMPDLGYSRYHQYAAFGGGPDRMAAYEEMWRREESELWEWLEERVGLDRMAGAPAGAAPPASSPPRKKAVPEGPRAAEEKLREARADDREIREAIRVTEEKLKALKAAVEKKNP